jgi:hypothetical protein
MLLKELLSLLESNDKEETEHIIMGAMSGHMNDLVPEVDFNFTDLDDYNRRPGHYKGHFEWEHQDDPEKHGRGTVEFSCGFHGGGIYNIAIHDLTGLRGVEVNQSIFSDEEN